MAKTLSLNDILRPDDLATEIVNKQVSWNHGARSTWKTQKTELLSYLFATDTKHTSAQTTPWKNKTTRPKLCQIRDSLETNYMAALFPSSEWLSWEPAEIGHEFQKKKDAILRYIKSKIQHPESHFAETINQLVLDFIDYGVAFAIGNQYHSPTYTNNDTVVNTYKGPFLSRISPMDVVIDPSGPNLTETPKIHREFSTMGDLHNMLESSVEGWEREAIEKAIKKRNEVADKIESIGDMSESHVISQYTVAGFGNPSLYFGSDTVEILTLYGSIYDTEAKKFHPNRIVKVLDRSTVVMNEPNYSTNGSPIIRAVGWRKRPDILWPMGPLDNLVGMQYRIDHLENMKADVFDHIANPHPFVRGDIVTNIENLAPGEPIYGSETDSIEYLHPPTTALNADIQIRELEERMEEYAGAPRQAMGIRTPGEKTKYEVQTLDNNSSRVFQFKAAWFEQHFIEPLLNDGLDAAVRAMPETGEMFVYKDPNTGLAEEVEITKEDLNMKGTLRPIGARHHAQRANQLQNMMQYQLSARPEVWANIDHAIWARVDMENLDLTRYGVIQNEQTNPSTNEEGPEEATGGAPGVPNVP